MVVGNWRVTFHDSNSVSIHVGRKFSDASIHKYTLTPGQVEQETSVIGAKVIGSVAAIAACFGYFAFRHWLSNRGKSAPTVFAGAIDR
jgi:hypothetical protein